MEVSATTVALRMDDVGAASKRHEVYGVTRLRLGGLRVPFPGNLLFLKYLPPVKRAISLKWATRLGKTFERTYRVLRRSGEPPMTRFLAAQLANSHWFDISAARRVLGYKPAVSTAEGMKRLDAWFQS